MTYREIPFSEYQQKANALLRKHGISENDKLPIDPENIIRLEGIELIPSPQLKQRFGIRGCVVKYNDQLQIYIDDYHYDNEPESCFLTMGEELGHCILHLVDFGKIRTIRDWMDISKKNRDFSRFIENQARMFGSNIILPSFILEGYLMKWVRLNLKSIQRFNVTVQDLAHKTTGHLYRTGAFRPVSYFSQWERKRGNRFGASAENRCRASIERAPRLCSL